jgi:Resolvase, N terminal domain
LQRDALAEAGCGRIFTEQLSGAVTDRPALRDALELARSGTLIVWKLDRLARSMKQLIETIEKLRVRGIGFRSLTEALDTTTAHGRLVFHMFGALAEFERSLIRERTQAGLAAARRVGRTEAVRRNSQTIERRGRDAKAVRDLRHADIGIGQHRLGGLDGSTTIYFGPTQPAGVKRGNYRPCLARVGSRSFASTARSNLSSRRIGGRARSNWSSKGSE